MSAIPPKDTYQLVFDRLTEQEQDAVRFRVAQGINGRPGDVYRFYEINPEVIELAKTEFSFLGSSAAKIETLLGDADAYRSQLERHRASLKKEGEPRL